MQVLEKQSTACLRVGGLLERVNTRAQPQRLKVRSVVTGPSVEFFVRLRGNKKTVNRKGHHSPSKNQANGRSSGLSSEFHRLPVHNRRPHFLVILHFTQATQ